MPLVIGSSSFSAGAYGSGGVQIPIVAIDEATETINKVAAASENLKETNTGVGSSAEEAGSGMETLGASIVAADVAYQAILRTGEAIIKYYQDAQREAATYTKDVGDLTRATGLSSETASRYLQVANANNISAKELSKILIENKGNYGDIAKAMGMSTDELERQMAAVQQYNILSDDQLKKQQDAVNSSNALQQAWKNRQVVAGEVANAESQDWNKWAADVVSANTQVMAADEAYRQHLKDLGRNPDRFTQTQALDYYASLQHGSRYNTGDTYYTEPAFQTGLKTTAADAQAVAHAMEEASQATKAYDVEQKNLLSDGLSLTKNIQDYNVQLGDLTQKLDEVTHRYGENSKQVADVKKQIEDLKGANTQQTNEWVLNLMKQAGATSQNQRAFAEMSGMVDEKAESIQYAIEKLTEDLNHGYLTSRAYYSAVHQLIDNLNNLNGMDAIAYTRLIITSSIAGSLGTAAASRVSSVVNGNVKATPEAEGGTWEPGKWVLTGDKPGGILTPYSELIDPQGNVIPADVTRALVMSGVVKPTSAALGGDFSDISSWRSAHSGGAASAYNFTLRHGANATSDIIRNAANKARGIDATTTQTSDGSAEVQTQQAVASAVMPLADQTKASVQAIQQNQQQTVIASRQQQAATEIMTSTLSAKLDQLIDLTARQPTTEDTFAAYRNAALLKG